MNVVSKNKEYTFLLLNRLYEFCWLLVINLLIASKNLNVKFISLISLSKANIISKIFIFAIGKAVKLIDDNSISIFIPKAQIKNLSNKLFLYFSNSSSFITISFLALGSSSIYEFSSSSSSFSSPFSTIGLFSLTLTFFTGLKFCSSLLSYIFVISYSTTELNLS